MQPIDSESIKRITNGDLIVRGYTDEIKKGRYEDGWLVVVNFRDKEEIEVERSALISSISTLSNVRRRLAYGELVDCHWYILNA